MAGEVVRDTGKLRSVEQCPGWGGEHRQSALFWKILRRIRSFVLPLALELMVPAEKGRPESESGFGKRNNQLEGICINPKFAKSAFF